MSKQSTIQESIAFGLLFSLVSANFLKGETISLPFRNRRAFLERLNARLKEIRYHLDKQVGDSFIYKYKSPFPTWADKISVLVESDSVTIVGPKLHLEKLKELRESVLSERKDNAQSVNSKTVAPSASTTAEPSAETRLQELKNLRDKGLITSEEYERKRAEILNEL